MNVSPEASAISLTAGGTLRVKGLARSTQTETRLRAASELAIERDELALALKQLIFPDYPDWRKRMCKFVLDLGNRRFRFRLPHPIIIDVQIDQNGEPFAPVRRLRFLQDAGV